MSVKTAFQSIRPSFLILTPVCVFLGFSTSSVNELLFNPLLFSLILIGAMAAHISVNTLNEYHDFKSGLDLQTIKTPFSGGSGALPNNPAMASSVYLIGMASLFVAIIIGIYLLMTHGSQILPIGLVGIVIIVTYTQWLNRFPLLCLIAPGLGFGTLMVVGTHVILKGEHSQLAWLISLVPFFLINNLLLLNQYPDIDADKSVGRNTFPIAFGIKNSNLVYALFMLAAFLLILIFIVMGYIPTLSLIALLPFGLSAFALSGAIKYAAKISENPQYLAANVASSILTPLLLGLSIIFG